MTRSLLFAALLLTTMPLPAAEIVRITAENYSTVLPEGKEVDAIIGDYLLRSDSLVAVVADTLSTRKANMTTRSVGGCVIDLTRRERQRDQLTAYFPGAMQFQFAQATILRAAGRSVLLRCETEGGANLHCSVTYELTDGDSFLTCVREIRNNGSKDTSVPLMDSMRADNTFEKSPNGETGLFWAYDHWYRQCYGLQADGRTISGQSDRRSSSLYLVKDGDRSAALAPKESIIVRTRLFAADNPVVLKALAAPSQGTATAVLEVKDKSGQPVDHADIQLKANGKDYGPARTEADGKVALPLPAGEYSATIEALGRGSKTVPIQVTEGKDVRIPVELDAPPLLSATVTDGAGESIPCKLQFVGVDETKDPYFGPNTQGPGVNNCYYSHDGRFTTVVPPGKYKVLVTYGPEYNAAMEQLEFRAGETTKLAVKLERVVQSPGWISSDIHAHSTPSGDNVTSTLGRVLNILAEQLEFHPCTEHNRLESYTPILKSLGCEDKLATCVGMELTGQPLPLNHQNAFPLVLRRGMQDNGAPEIDDDPEVQIRRLAGWDNGSEKLVQTNHPDLGWMFFDRNSDQKPDAGFYRMFAFQDVIEIWGNDTGAMQHESILAMRPKSGHTPPRNDRLFNWLQMLNAGYQIVGVANTDAHYTDHGSGWVRNYVRSSTDDVTRIDTMEMVREYKAGHVVMTNGPYLDVSVKAGDDAALPGDTINAAKQKLVVHVRVQCPNWFDIDRVQLLLNGRAPAEFNFTRREKPDVFSDKVVKFERDVELDLKQDTHVIVVAAGTPGGFGDYLGPAHKQVPPTAISNPIFLDVDGEAGFLPNGDTLDHPLPVAAEQSRRALPKLAIEKAKEKRAKGK